MAYKNKSSLISAHEKDIKMATKHERYRQPTRRVSADLNEAQVESAKKYIQKMDIFLIQMLPAVQQAYTLISKIETIIELMRLNKGINIFFKRELKMGIRNLNNMATKMRIECDKFQDDFMRQLKIIDENTDIYSISDNILIAASQQIYFQMLIHNACIADEGNALKIESMLKAMANKPEHKSYIPMEIIKEFEK